MQDLEQIAPDAIADFPFISVANRQNIDRYNNGRRVNVFCVRVSAF